MAQLRHRGLCKSWTWTGLTGLDHGTAICSLVPSQIGARTRSISFVHKIALMVTMVAGENARELSCAGPSG